MAKVVRVYVYGVYWLPDHSKKSGSFTPAERTLIFDQLRKSHRYRNVLVEMERKRRNAYRALRASLAPELAVLEAEHDRLSKLIDDKRKGLSAVLKKDREQDALAARIRELRGERAKAWVKIRTLRKEVEDKHFKPHDEALATLIREKKEAWEKENGHAPGPHTSRKIRIDARAELADRGVSKEWKAKDDLDWTAAEEKRDARSKSGCFPGNYIAVEDAAQRSFAETRWQPRFVFWRAEGKVGSQIKGMVAEKVLAGSEKALAIRILPPKPGMAPPKKPWAMVDLRLGGRGEGTRLSVPIIYDRPLPPDSRVLWAYLVVRRLGTTHYAEMQLTIETEAPVRAAAERKPLIALNLGYRAMPDGSIRVATGWDGENHKSLSLEPVFKEATGFVERLLSYARRHFDEARVAVMPLLASLGFSAEEAEDLGLGTIGQWRSHGRLARLASAATGKHSLGGLPREWKQERLAGKKDLFDVLSVVRAWLAARGVTDERTVVTLYLELWRRKDAHLIDWARRLELRMRRRRKDLYQVWAKRLAAEYQDVCLEEWNKADTAETPDPEDDTRTPQEENSGRVRKIAAISVLSSAIEHAFGKEYVSRADPTRITLEHFGCGGESSDAVPEVKVTCTHCGKDYDQDRNAAKNLYYRKTASSGGDDASKPRPKKAKKGSGSPPPDSVGRSAAE